MSLEIRELIALGSEKSKGEVRVLYKLRPTKILTFGPVEG